MTEVSAVEKVNERVEKMRERADHRPEAWRFDDNGPEFVGYFIRWERSETGGYNGRPAAIALFMDLEGKEWAVWCFHKVLAGEMVKADPMAGELVLIKYLGKVEPDGGGAGYDLYRVVVDRVGGGLSIGEVAKIAEVEDELDGRTDSPPLPDESQIYRGQDEHPGDDIPY